MVKDHTQTYDKADCVPSSFVVVPEVGAVHDGEEDAEEGEDGVDDNVG